MFRKLKQLFRKAIGHTLAAVLPPRLMMSKLYFDLWEKRGYHVKKVHYYEPIPDTREWPKDIFERETGLPGIDVNSDAQSALVCELAAQFGHEFGNLESWVKFPGKSFKYRNQAFGAVDAEILYALIRKHKPRTLIEIGSGYSTLISAAAMEKNRSENPGEQHSIICIEPYPRDWLMGLPPFVEIRKSKIEDQPLELFEKLGENDILFIDSSHVVNTYNDVCCEYLEIIPRLKKGVLVHIHDIVLPQIYSRDWYAKRRFWNEQYLLQALLCHSSAFRVLWAGQYMHLKHPSIIAENIPSYAKARATGDGRLIRIGHKSFWIHCV